MISTRSSGSGRLAFGMNALIALIKSLVELQIVVRRLFPSRGFYEQSMAKRTMLRTEHSLWARA